MQWSTSVHVSAANCTKYILFPNANHFQFLHVYSRQATTLTDCIDFGTHFAASSLTLLVMCACRRLRAGHFREPCILDQGNIDCTGKIPLTLCQPASYEELKALKKKERVKTSIFQCKGS